jgi:hypothetical protein
MGHRNALLSDAHVRSAISSSVNRSLPLRVWHDVMCLGLSGSRGPRTFGSAFGVCFDLRPAQANLELISASVQPSAGQT